MGAPPSTTRDDFDHWVADMDDSLERFRDALPEDVSRELDGSIGSLDALEAWILQRYPDTEAMLADDQAEPVDGAARYIGEVFRRELGSQYWDIDLDNRDAAFFNLPVLTSGPGSTPVAPAALATAAAQRRTGSFLRTVLENSRS
jgi:hypothetical protein